MKKNLINVLSFLTSLVMAIGLVHAAEPKNIGEFGDWTAYLYMEDNNKVCYMVSKPKKQEGDYAKRGDVFALITHRPAEKSTNVFSFVAGYPYKADSEVNVNIGRQDFRLFTQNETAWATDAATDNRLATAIRSGSAMIIKGTSAKGTPTTDTFGLKGSSAAHAAISKECGIK
ncbi:MAG: invasion associated locus B family protein [Nitrosomonas sp.]|nr:invasion associated locus B family protein [Nitrosomonas sp.]